MSLCPNPDGEPRIAFILEDLCGEGNTSEIGGSGYSRVSVALTVPCNISPTFSNFDEKAGSDGFQRKTGFIDVS